MKETIHIYHTNDLHSHFENWPKINHFLNERKAEHELAGEDVFLFDIGDFADRWHPFTEGTLGKGNVELLNEAGYTAVTIGNNEGITLSHQALDDLYTEAQFDVIAANFYYPDRQRPEWALPYKIYMTNKGTRIGVTAVTTYYRKLYELLGWELSEPLTELGMQLNNLQGKTDMIILLSHLGIYDDEKIAELFPQVDLILGSHTHHLLREGKRIGDTVLAAAGRYGEFVGYVKAVKKRGKRSKLKAVVHETAALPSIPGEEEIIAHFSEIGKNQLNKEIVEIPKSIDYSWVTSSPLAALLCEALNEWCEADCSMINSGLLLTALQKGKVTKYDLHRMLPHPINPCTIELTGAELKEVLFQADAAHWSTRELKGLGFRGHVMGAFVFHQIKMDRSRHIVKIAGKPLLPEKIYTLGTIDLFTFGQFFPEIHRATEKKYFMPEFLRDVMEWKLKNLYTG